MAVPGLSFYYDEGEEQQHRKWELLEPTALIPRTNSRKGDWSEEATRRSEAKEIAHRRVIPDSGKQQIDERVERNHPYVRQSECIAQRRGRGYKCTRRRSDADCRLETGYGRNVYLETCAGQATEHRRLAVRGRSNASPLNTMFRRGRRGATPSRT